MIKQMREAIRFAETVTERPLSGLQRVDFFTCHEALHLPYEEVFTRRPSHCPEYYNLGTHFPWIGKRTLQLGSAHVEYMRGVCNPIGLKVSPGLAPSDLTKLVRYLDPDNTPGRITLITRLGADGVERLLPPLVKSIQAAGHKVLWCCDPMHGNTERAQGGYKTRRFENILGELTLTFDIHASLGTNLGGVHFELTGEEVTECVGGASGIDESDLRRAYHSVVDPRLNAKQSLEMALRIVNKHSAMQHIQGYAGP